MPKSGRSGADELVNGIVYKRRSGRAMLDIEIWKNNPDEWDHARNVAGERLAAMTPVSKETYQT